MNLASVCFTQLWLKKKSNPQLSLYTASLIGFRTTLSSQYRKAKRARP